MSKNSYKTAPGGPDLRDLARKQLQENNQYAQLLRSRDLWPVNPATEQDWSGRGQHVEFTKSEYGLINDILHVQGILGSTTGTIVETVRCRRILLARKTISCNRKFTKEQAIEEVAHLTRLSHAHILRVIGTYVVGKSLSILLYPVARYNLDEFLETLVSASTGRRQWIAMVNSCRTFFACLSEAISYIHSTFTKHLDIKPHNILVRKHLKPSCPILEYPYAFTVYIADFGVSRSYQREDMIETDGHVCFTRKYAAPEVVSLDKRGLPADVFSLGCVFLEMYIALFDASTGIPFYDNLAILQNSGAGYDKLKQLRRDDLSHTTHMHRLQKRLETSPKGNSYQANLDLLSEHYLATVTASQTPNTMPPAEKLQTDFTGALKLLIAAMMSFSPRDRPTAVAMRKLFLQNACCGKGPCQLEAKVSDSDEGDDSDEG
ncbi:hypothetical protein E8E11_007801 [Didymella keratinophila]|nr:hypothetical protein E8E11_007801 [Didymella keratinophila]